MERKPIKLSESSLSKLGSNQLNPLSWTLTHL